MALTQKSLGTSDLNDFNVKSKGSGKTLDIMCGYVKAFEKKLEVFRRDVDGEKFKYFPNLGGT